MLLHSLHAYYASVCVCVLQLQLQLVFVHYFYISEYNIKRRCGGTLLAPLWVADLSFDCFWHCTGVSWSMCPAGS